eukprot:scaffold1388_cov390-Prasinococcus_capsulatus_cf.AAC.9
MAELKANMVEVQDDDEFQQLLSTFPNRPVVLRLGAPWCQHCKKMEQPFKEIGASFKITASSISSDNDSAGGLVCVRKRGQDGDVWQGPEVHANLLLLLQQPEGNEHSGQPTRTPVGDCWTRPECIAWALHVSHRWTRS